MIDPGRVIIEAANNFGDTREGAGAGPLALAVVALLAIATVLLWRNMTARIKRLPAEFPSESTATGSPVTGPTTGGPTEPESGPVEKDAESARVESTATATATEKPKQTGPADHGRAR